METIQVILFLLLGLLFVLLGNLVELVDLKRLFKRQSVGEGSA